MTKDKPTEFMFKPRGVGNNWYPCFICGHKPQQKCQYDMASFIDTSQGHVVTLTDPPLYTHPITDLFWENDIHVGELDYRASEPNRVQLKLGACGEHKPNLELLGALCYDDGKITEARLRLCIPERKRP